MRDNIPYRLSIRKSDRSEYERLQEKDSPLRDRANKDLFMMAMITGFCENNKVKLDARDGFIFDHYLTPKDLTVMKAIAIAESDSLSILLDKRQVYSIAEEYATGGILLLKNEIFGGDYGSYAKRLESKIIEKHREIFESSPCSEKKSDS